MFRDGRAVKAHMKAHSEPNTIHCELCGKAFSLRAAYANHVKIHDPNSSGRARRRYRRVFPPNPVRKPLPIPPPPLPEPRSASPPPPLIHHPPPEVEEFTMETEEEGTDSAVKCPACLVPAVSKDVESYAATRAATHAGVRGHFQVFGGL